jgi:PPOX class probable FMN-dependent enzyme
VDDWSFVTTPAELREVVGHPVQRVADKVRDRLHPMDVAFLAHSPFWALATSSAAGRCDVSPKGDPGGSSVLVLSQTCLALAERPGNRRVDGFLNALENPHVGLLFLVPGRGDTLRVNGRARLVREAPFFDDLVVEGHRPKLALVVDVEEVFFHCAKAFLRSKLWDPVTWPASDALPSRSVIAKAMERADQSLEEISAYYGAAYADGLYKE